ncbi:MAG: hypothetical protein GEU97_10300 [Actinophytocola sp.]|nr:hypothetical protein [Actinophytocola sp.]
MAESQEQPAKRSLLVTIAALLLSAIAFWGASTLAWLELNPGSQVSSTISGADLAGWLVPLAVLALAAVAAVLALPGVVRWVLGVGLAVAGVLALWFILSGSPYDTPRFTYAPDTTADPERTFAGPAAAVAGAVLLLAAGALLLVRGPRMPRLGAKYSAPGGKPPAEDADEDMWRALSDGEDPTSGT